jgi:hypothetical protein
VCRGKPMDDGSQTGPNVQLSPSGKAIDIVKLPWPPWRPVTEQRSQFRAPCATVCMPQAVHANIQLCVAVVLACQSALGNQSQSLKVVLRETTAWLIMTLHNSRAAAQQVLQAPKSTQQHHGETEMWLIRYAQSVANAHTVAFGNGCRVPGHC